MSALVNKTYQFDELFVEIIQSKLRSIQWFFLPFLLAYNALMILFLSHQYSTEIEEQKYELK